MDKTTLIIIGLVCIFLLFRAISGRRRQTRLREGMLISLSVGDEITTTSGMIGVIAEILEDDTMVVEFSGNPLSRIRMSKGAVYSARKKSLYMVEGMEEETFEPEEGKKQ